MKCTFFGTGYSVTTAKRHNTSLFFQTDSTDLLVDCNGACGQRLCELGINFDSINHIYLTHKHIDHLGALPNLVHQIWVKACLYCEDGEQRKHPLHIYANNQTIDCVKALFSALSLFDEPKMFPFVFHTLSDEGGDILIGDIHISYFPVSHNQVPCLGFSAWHDGDGGRKYIYSADSEPVDEIYSNLQSGDVMIHDCNRIYESVSAGHTTWKQLEVVMESFRHVYLYLVHLPDITDVEEREFSRYLMEHYERRVQLGRDSLTINL